MAGHAPEAKNVKPSCVIVCNLGVRGRSMPSVIPAWRKVTGRCEVWDWLQRSEETGTALGIGGARPSGPLLRQATPGDE